MEVRNVSAMSFPKQAFKANDAQGSSMLNQAAPMDSVEFSTQKAEPPKISRLRLMFGLLKDDQVKAINESGRLPDNAKFIMNNVGNGYTICNNFFGLRAGTKELPAGFEVKKSVFGFAQVVPKGTEGALLKN